jgi:hypothetical protein
MNDIEQELRDLGDRTAQEVTYREVPRRRIVRRARLRRGLTIAAPVLAVVLFAAVAYPRLDSSGDGRDGVPVSVDLAAAAEATESAGTARIEMAMSMDFDGQSLTSEMSGEIDFDDERSYFRMTGMGAFSPVDEVEIISIGDVMYQREAGDAKWVKSRFDAPDGASGWGGGPTEFFSYLESVSDEVTSFGKEVVDGVTVTHLSATVDPSKLAEESGARGMRLEPIHVWIDDADRVRKMSYAMTIAGPDGQTGSTTVTMRFLDFGVPVDVQVPPAEDVTDESSSSWGGAGGDLVGSDDGSGPMGTYSGKTTYLTGARGFDEPYVALSSPKQGAYVVCVENLPRRWTEAEVVERGAGRTIAGFAGASIGPPGSGGGTMCSGVEIPEHEAEHLITDTGEYSLRFTTARGQLVVRLTTSSEE